MTSDQLAAWYSNQENLARSFRNAAISANLNGDTPEVAPTSRPRQPQAEPANTSPSRQDIRLAFAEIAKLSDAGAGILGRSVTRAFGQIASEITSLLAGDQPRSPEDINRRNAAENGRVAAAEAEASQRRRYGREMETQARERTEAEIQEAENQRRRRNERQRW